MNRGVARHKTFFSDIDRVEFGRLLGVAGERCGVEIHAYCLMPNHYHLVLRCPDGGLSDFVQYLASVYTRHTNERLGRDGPLFRGRFRSRPIDEDAYLLAAVRYVHRNPLSLASVGAVEAYRWSSHRSYLRYRKPPPWLSTDVVLGMFGDDVGRFHDFVAAERCTSEPRCDVRGLDDAIWLAVEEAGELGRAPQGIARTVRHLAADLLEPGTTSPALRRARRQADTDPRLLAIARNSLHLLP
jgi:REP element-mobilizing transposase RayT